MRDSMERESSEKRKELRNSLLKIENRLKEFEFLCGDTVWFRGHKYKEEQMQIKKGMIVRVSLTEQWKSWHYNLQVSFEEYDWFKDNGEIRTSVIYLTNTDEEKQVFKSLEELNVYEKQKD